MLHAMVVMLPWDGVDGRAAKSVYWLVLPTQEKQEGRDTAPQPSAANYRYNIEISQC